MSAKDFSDWSGGWVWSIFGPILAVAALVFVAMDAQELARAAKNEGVPGTFTSERRECEPRGGCTVHGSFVSDDGAIELDDVFIDDGAPATGRTVDAQYFPGSRTEDKVYELSSHDWVWALCLAVGAVTYLGLWWWRVALPRLRFRSRHRAPRSR